MRCKLSDLCDYVKEKISITLLNENNYISTENMLPNKGGIERASSIPNTQSTQGFRIGDVLVSNIRPYFKKIWKATFDGGCSNDVLVFRAKKECNSDFLYYVLADDRFFEYSMSTAKGTKMPRGDKKALLNYTVPDLDIITQAKIATILSMIDKKIQVNKSISASLSEAVKLVFNHYFLSDNTTAWPIKKLGDYLSLERGLSYKGQYLSSDEGVPMINLGNILPNSVFRADKIKFYTGEFKQKAIVKPGDIVVANTDLTQAREVLGSAIIVPDLGYPTIICSHHISIVRKCTISKYFLLGMLNAPSYRGRVIGYATGTTVLALPNETILKCEFALPPEELLQQYDEFAAPAYNLIEHNRFENVHLSKMRDALLPQLLSGKIDISEV